MAKRKSQKRMVEQARRDCGEIEQGIRRGDCMRLEYKNDRFTVLSGECGNDEVYLHLRTNKGEVTLVLSDDDLLTLEGQCTDLGIYFESKNLEKQRDMDAMGILQTTSEAVH
jgi:hypothetical protein